MEHLRLLIGGKRDRWRSPIIRMASLTRFCRPSIRPAASVRRPVANAIPPCPSAWKAPLESTTEYRTNHSCQRLGTIRFAQQISVRAELVIARNDVAGVSGGKQHRHRRVLHLG